MGIIIIIIIIIIIMIIFSEHETKIMQAVEFIWNMRKFLAGVFQEIYAQPPVSLAD